MRLSDSIALGRTLLTPARRSLGDGKSGCALGMALISKGIIAADPLDLQCPVENWPWLSRAAQPPCDCLYIVGYCYNAAQVITHLFDSHVMSAYPGPKWTLDELIDWVRSVEPADTYERIATPLVAEEQLVSQNDDPRFGERRDTAKANRRAVRRKSHHDLFSPQG